ncbi:Hypothetical predicted protein [Paramuricea clavata]|uniref:Uncharacterized protein n=1 Tax=Paramuricea clavata TaxID=317549 RepID=A0A6S7JTL7_PARCT|nr:Hypothetical predicted protein [Paramuricea clavata]
MTFKIFLLVVACFIFADARKYDNFDWDEYRNLELPKRYQQNGSFDMCHVTDKSMIMKARIANGEIKLRYYNGNAKCVPKNKTIKLKTSRRFECRPIKHEIISGSNTQNKTIIIVGCKVVIFN